MQYLMAKIYAVSGQPKYREGGDYNYYFYYAAIELQTFLTEIDKYYRDDVSNFGVFVARVCLDFMKNKQRRRKKNPVVCPMSAKQAYAIAIAAARVGINFRDFPDIQREYRIETTEYNIKN